MVLWLDGSVGSSHLESLIGLQLDGSWDRRYLKAQRGWMSRVVSFLMWLAPGPGWLSQLGACWASLTQCGLST